MAEGRAKEREGERREGGGKGKRKGGAEGRRRVRGRWGRTMGEAGKKKNYIYKLPINRPWRPLC